MTGDGGGVGSDDRAAGSSGASAPRSGAPSRKAPWVAVARIARRDVMRNKGRTWLVALLIGVPVAAATWFLVVLGSTVSTPESDARLTLGPVVKAEALWEGTPVLQEPNGASIAIDDGEGGAPKPPPPASEVSATLQELLPTATISAVSSSEILASKGSSRSRFSYLRIATDDARVRDWLGVPESGRWPENPNEAMISAQTAAILKAGIGDSIALVGDGEQQLDGPENLTIVGVAAQPMDAKYSERESSPGIVSIAGSFETADGEIVESTAGDNSSWWITGIDVPWNDVLRLNEAGLTVTSMAVGMNMPDSADVPFYDKVGQERSSTSMSSWLVIVVFALVGLLETGLLLAPAFIVGARRSERDLALVAANGGEPKALRRIVLMGAGIVGTFASVIAVMLGTVIAVLSLKLTDVAADSGRDDVSVPLGQLLILLVVAILVCLGAALASAVRAGQVNVVAALNGRTASHRIRRGRHVMALALLGAGLLALAAGAWLVLMPLVMLGVLVSFIGVLLNIGWVVELLSKASPKFGPAGRFALRDAARQRSRSIGSIAAVVGAIAAITATSGWTAAQQAGSLDGFNPVSADGKIAVVSAYQQPGMTPAEQFAYDKKSYAKMADAAITAVPGTTAVPVRVAVRSDLGSPESVGTSVGLSTEPDPKAGVCASAECQTFGGSMMRLTWISSMTGAFGRAMAIVDDGALLDATGLEGSADAAAALRSGKVLLPNAFDIWSDGKARLTTVTHNESTDESATMATMVVPAAVSGLPPQTYPKVLPPAVAEQLGLHVVPGGLLLTPPKAATDQDIALIKSAILSIDELVSVEVSNAPVTNDAGSRIAMIAALIAGICVTAVVLFLAAHETKRDMRVYAAVGARPRTRRKIAAAQAAVVTAVGTVFGAVMGHGFAWVMVQVDVSRREDLFQAPVWQSPGVYALAMCLGVPLIAALGGFIFTRSRLPLPQAIR